MLCKHIAFHSKPLLHITADEIPAHMQPVYNHINFRPVAGGNDNPFQHAFGLHQLMQCRRQVLFGKSELFPDLYRRRTVIQANHDNMHRLFTILISIHWCRHCAAHL
ncbi:hypothetical protein D3C74_416530 [compost metagenome]